MAIFPLLDPIYELIVVHHNTMDAPSEFLPLDEEWFYIHIGWRVAEEVGVLQYY